MGFFEHDDRTDLGGLEGADHELSGILVPGHDVDAFAAELVRHGIDAGAAHAYAGADRIDAAVAGVDGDLGAHARITGGGLDLEEAFLDFRDFKLEELLDEFGGRAGEEHLLALVGLADMVDVGAHAVTRAEILTRNHLIARQAGFKTADFNDGVALVDALDRASHDAFVAIEELLEDLLAFGVTQALKDDLLGVLSEAAARRVDVDHFDLALDEFTGLDFRIFVDDVGIHFLTVRLLETFLVGNDEPAAGGLEFARHAVDMHDDVGVLTGELSLLDGAGKRGLEHAEDGVLGNILFACEHVDKLEHFTAVH